MKFIFLTKKVLALQLLLWFSVTIAIAQSGSDLRINEILVENDSNFVDDFGQRNAWIEIFNSAYNKVNIAGMYLTNDPSNPTKYQIPKGDPVTVIPPRNYLVFYADKHPTRGILHLNFDLKDSKYLALYDVNGSSLIDEIRIPEIGADTSYGRALDGSNEWIILDKTTPKANNFTGVASSPGEEFLVYDPFGFGMALIAMMVVFSSLVFLYLIFKNTKRLYTINFKQLHRISMKQNSSEELPDLTGEVNAAIAMALYFYRNELHDHEAAVLTIKKVARTYSPWSSKIYGLRTYHK